MWRLVQRSLILRLIGISLLLLLLVQAAGFTVVRASIERNARTQIARELDIAETTVKIHVQHILRKLGLTNRVHAAVYATGRGVI